MIAITLLLTNVLGVASSNFPFFLKEHKESDLFSSINKSANVCTDFYNFVCEPWMKKTVVPNNQPIWNKWEMVNHKIIERLEKILSGNNSKNNYLYKAHNLYQACLNTNLETRYVNELKMLIKNLNGWPIVTPRWKESGYAWEVIVAKIIRLLGVHPLLKIHVFVDLKNTSQYALYLEPGELNLPHTILNHAETYKSYLEEYEQWIENTIKYLYPKNKNNYKFDIKQMINFEIELAKLLVYKNKFERMSVDSLRQSITLDWKAVFDMIFHNTSVGNSYSNKIVLRNRQYMEKLLDLISVTKKDTVANYIIWSVVKSLSRDSTMYMRKLNFQMDRRVYGVKEDLPRIQECVKKVLTYMDSYLIKEYTKIYINQQTITSVDLMLKNIKIQFLKTLKKNKWLDRQTKSLAMEKITALKYIVVAPKCVEDKAFDAEIQNVEVSPNNHFLNTVQMRALRNKLNFETLREKVIFKWTDTLFEVNAFYNVLQNTIFIPVGLLEPPFFNLSAPLAANYGALGTLFGHELSHALDTSGRHADKDGNIVNWWTPKSTNNYEERVACFDQQYHKHNATNDFMIGENIADNVGLQLSFNALWNVESLKLQKYKNLKKYANQIFFINYSQIWCEVSNNNLIEIGEHPPVRIRVLETLQNSQDFFNAFDCVKVNENYCRLW